jgi:glycogen debranching enzyme
MLDHALNLNLLSRVLCDLGRVEYLADLGRNGPLVASAGSESLFHCLFGRDSIRIAFDLLEDFPLVAERTLVELARLQGVAFNPRAEEEPGRILHEHRHPGDPHAARLSEHWDFPYYGAVDSTPLWMCLLGAYCQRQGTAILAQPLTNRAWQSITLRDSLLAAARWLLGRLDDPRGDGLLWVQRVSPHGILNQVWEDSPDSYHHADSAIYPLRSAYAPINVQGYAYDALLITADLLELNRDGQPSLRPADLRERASRLRAHVLAQLWQPDLGTFAHALEIDADGHCQPARVATSAAGHLLDSHLLDGPDAAPVRERLVRRLFESDLLDAAGIRTKSTANPRFRAGSYHNGSTWPMDTGVIADGLRRHGYHHLADDLEERILSGCASVGSFPEFFRGDSDGTIRVNTEVVDAVVDGAWNRLEQPPQANQGWTASRVWRILRHRADI